MKFIELNGFNGKYFICKNGDIKNKSGLIIKTFKSNGYIRITLIQNKVKKNFYIHRLLAETFIPNPNNFHEIDHIDRNRSNNSIKKLRWSTRSLNNFNKK